MKNWFYGLEDRERLVVAVGACIVALALIYGFVWTPLDKKHRETQASVVNWQRSLAELQPLKGVVSDTRSASTSATRSQQSPIIIVDQTLRGRGLEQFRKRSQPTSSNGIRVEFEDVAFDELVLWLGDLAEQYGMIVQSGSLAAGNRSGPGRVNAALTLERAP
jgi:general secretion pathway protein M